jgi:hypothetical protein
VSRNKIPVAIHFLKYHLCMGVNSESDARGTKIIIYYNLNIFTMCSLTMQKPHITTSKTLF